VANLLRALRTEIRAAARGESKAVLGSIRSELESLKKSLAMLERRMARGGGMRGFARLAPERGAGGPKRRARFSPGLMRKHREALGMSRKAYARLLGVSSLSIYLWEAGRTRPRRATIFAWQDVRKRGARELRAIAGVPAPKRAAKASRAAKPTRAAKAARGKVAKRARAAKPPAAKRGRRARPRRTGARRRKAA
jgi:transcriptional regulator with XRE-family HTH domain